MSANWDSIPVLVLLQLSKLQRVCWALICPRDSAFGISIAARRLQDWLDMLRVSGSARLDRQQHSVHE